MSEDPRNTRGQLSLTVIEAAVGILFVVAVTSGFALGVPMANTQAAQLDTYADDVATVLTAEPPRHADETRLAEVAESPSAFDREHPALSRRIERILPANLMYRVQTPHGTIGFPRPAGIPVGMTRVPTATGTVTIWVWYA